MPLSPVDFNGATQMLEILRVFTWAVGLGASGLRSAVENLDDPSMETNIPLCEACVCKYNLLWGGLMFILCKTEFKCFLDHSGGEFYPTLR